MRGIQMAAAMLGVVISPSFSVAVAQGAGAQQSTTHAAAEAGLSLDGIPMGRPLEFLQTQTAAGFEEQLSFVPQVMGPAFYTTWINPTIQGQRPMKTVRLSAHDRTGRVVSVTDAVGIVPHRIEFPKLDGASRDHLRIKVTYSTPRINQVPGPATSIAFPAVNQNLQLIACNFRLLIPGLETTQVTKIDAISIAPRGANLAIDPRKQPLSPPGGGPLPERKTPTPMVGTMTISGLVISVPQAHVQSYQDWLTHAPGQTKTGSLAYLKADRSGAWGTLALQGLSITRITPEPGVADGIRRMKVEMTIGGLQFMVN